MNIPDLITILRNSIKVNKNKIVVRPSRKAKLFLDVLILHNYISTYSLDKRGQIQVFFDYGLKKNKIKSLKHISRPSNPVYFSPQDLWKFQNKVGIVILNTSHGMISNTLALRKNIGGEALCYIL